MSDANKRFRLTQLGQLLNPNPRLPHMLQTLPADDDVELASRRFPPRASFGDDDVASGGHVDAAIINFPLLEQRAIRAVDVLRTDVGGRALTRKMRGQQPVA
jgi:hypothetical protein